MAPLSLESEPVAVDLQDLIDRCLGNLALVERIVAKFENCFDDDLAQLEAAILNEDGPVVARLAHRLKGASANLSAEGLRACAEEVEKLARQGCLADIGDAVEALRSERSRFVEAISSLRDDFPKAQSAGRGVGTRPSEDFRT